MHNEKCKYKNAFYYLANGKLNMEKFFISWDCGKSPHSFQIFFAQKSSLGYLKIKSFTTKVL